MHQLKHEAMTSKRIPESSICLSYQIGKCRSFCPELELKRRQDQKMLHVLEVDGSGQSRGALVVKEYVRACAGQLVPSAQNLRPTDVLLNTIHYLIKSVLDRTDYPWYVIYEFVTNRIQAIRQDITYQALVGPDVTLIFQLASRFHIYSQYRLWTYPVDKFDPKLNLDHLQQCLIKTIRSDGCDQSSWGRSLEQVAEFEAYYVLTNLGNCEVLNHILSLRKDIRLHPLVQSAVAISLSIMSNNFVRCCRLISQLPPLHRAAVVPHIYQLQRRALQTMCAAYSSKTESFPIKVLCKWILIEDVVKGIELCTSHGILVQEENAHFRRGCFKLPDQVPKVTITISEFFEQHHPSQYIEQKMTFNQ